MITVMLCLALLALALAVAVPASAGKVPIWAAVLVLCLIELLRVMPIG
jgi:hypothetical protein